MLGKMVSWYSKHSGFKEFTHLSEAQSWGERHYRYLEDMSEHNETKL